MKILFSTLVMSLLFAGCSSNTQSEEISIDAEPAGQIQKTEQTEEQAVIEKLPEEKQIKLSLDPPLTDEMKAELKQILDRNLTEDEWKRLRRNYDVLGAQLDTSDVETQLILICTPPFIYNNENLQKELEGFFQRYSYGQPRFDPGKLLEEAMKNKLEGR
jgi:hypothetical protein